MLDQITEEIKKPFYQTNFPNDGQRFVAWFLRNIHNRSEIETKDDITDGPNDKQIDAVYIDNDKGAIYIIQGKFYSGGIDADPLREVLSAWVQIQDLASLQANGNDKIKRKVSEIATAIEDDYEIIFELLTTGNLTDAAKDDLDLFQRKLTEISEANDFSCSINLVDSDEIIRRYEIALGEDNPKIKHTFSLAMGKFVSFELAGSNVIVAALPLSECIKIPGIKDGSLFRKNVRQSLGLTNAVNKGIKHTIYSDSRRDFFFFHNGVTAIAEKVELNEPERTLKTTGLSVVNGCQSLNTILSCSEQVRKANDAYILFRIYEIPQRERADKISINTNSQSAVKQRDLRSNDKKVLKLKQRFEQNVPNGYFLTKRGEKAPADKLAENIVDLSSLGKWLIAWHSQRPTISYSETRIFDKYFELLFKRDYSPEDALALKKWMDQVDLQWIPSNPLALNESLLAMKAYAPYHHLFGISICFSSVNNQIDKVPSPSMTWEIASKNGLVDEVVRISGTCLNMALIAASQDSTSASAVFSPQNWIKAKKSLTGIQTAITQYLQMLPMMPGGQEIRARLFTGLNIEQSTFGQRWAAD